MNKYDIWLDSEFDWDYINKLPLRDIGDIHGKGEGEGGPKCQEEI